MLKNLSARNKTILGVVVIVILAIAGYFLYQHFNPAKIVTGESQAQAETPEGISLAAHNAHVGLMQDQFNTAAKKIKQLEGLPPVVVMQTIPYEVEKIVTQYVKTSGADFAIVTDPKKPDKVVDLKEIAKLPPTTPVVLNQYNVFAYQKILHEVVAFPSFNGITPSGLSELNYGIAKKITSSGKYLGLVTGYNFDHKEAKLGLSVTY